MRETVCNPIDRLELKDLCVGDRLCITTGTGEDMFTYDFMVSVSGKWPQGLFHEIRPDGTIAGPMEMSLHGSGIYTDRKQNPVQQQARAITSYFDSLKLGDFLIAAAPGANIGERLIFDMPGQEISGISLQAAID